MSIMTTTITTRRRIGALKMDWDACEIEQLTHEQFAAKLKSLNPQKRVRKIATGQTKFSFWCTPDGEGRWMLKALSRLNTQAFTRTPTITMDLFDLSQPEVVRYYKYARLYVREKNDENGYYVFKVYQTNLRDDSHNALRGAGTGAKAFEKVATKMAEGRPAAFTKVDGGTKKLTFDFAFGTTPKEYKNFIPHQFYYSGQQFKDQFIDHASYADFCSMFPSCMLGKLPDAYDAVEKEGRCEPTAEYPFAFYPDTYDLAEYKGFDTRKWAFFPDGTAKGLSAVLSNEKRTQAYESGRTTITKTVLMRAAMFTMDDCWKYFYAKRRDPNTPADEAADIKVTMNAFIGTLHMNNYAHQQAHVVAVVLARAGQKMLDLINNSHLTLSHIVQIAIDGIIYVGKDAVGGNEKALTKLYQNETDARLYWHNINCYCFVDGSGKITEVRHQGYNCDSQDHYLGDNWVPREPQELSQLKNDTSLQEMISAIAEEDDRESDEQVAKWIEDIKAGKTSLACAYPYQIKRIKQYEKTHKNA